MKEYAVKYLTGHDEGKPYIVYENYFAHTWWRVFDFIKNDLCKGENEILSIIKVEKDEPMIDDDPGEKFPPDPPKEI